ncbi:copper resistance protein NlpE N-terminal domain-containing protein [Flavobacterium sp.]|jgi:hypothetical protein|uniref:copper resistance protein NlpE N-terminal domain-containing protein n=1 Tax=Flavobacterium sp. TaxID=239 RepID=UPI0037BEECC9
MKQLLFILIVLLSSTINAQTDEYSGSYAFYVKAKKGEIIDYKLTLNADHTFLFTSYVNNNTNEYFQKGKGTWSVENKIVKFTTEPTDLDKEHNLNFSGSTARLIKKSPRDTSDKIIPTALQFYKSKIFWIANLKLLRSD